MSRKLDVAIAEALGYEVARLARDTGYMIHRSGGGGARFLPRPAQSFLPDTASGGADKLYYSVGS